MRRVCFAFIVNLALFFERLENGTDLKDAGICDEFLDAGQVIDERMKVREAILITVMIFWSLFLCCMEGRSR